MSEDKVSQRQTKLHELFPEMQNFLSIPKFGDSEDIRALSSSESDTDEEDEHKTQRKKQLNHVKQLLTGKKQPVPSRFKSQQEDSVVSATTPVEVSTDISKRLEFSEEENKVEEVFFKSNFKISRHDAQNEVHLTGLVERKDMKISKFKNSTKFELYENEHLPKACGTKNLLFYVYDDKEVRFINRKEPNYSLISPDFLTHIAFKTRGKGRISGIFAIELSDDITILLIFYSFGTIMLFEINHEHESSMTFRKIFAINCTSFDDDMTIFDHIQETSAPFIEKTRFLVEVKNSKVIVHENTNNTLFVVDVKAIAEKAGTALLWSDTWNIPQEQLFFGNKPNQSSHCNVLLTSVEVLRDSEIHSFGSLSIDVKTQLSLLYNTEDNKLFKANFNYSAEKQIFVETLVQEVKYEMQELRTVKDILPVDNGICFVLMQENRHKENELALFDFKAKNLILKVETGFTADNLIGRVKLHEKFVAVLLYNVGVKLGKVFVFSKHFAYLGAFQLHFESNIQSISICEDRTSKLNLVNFMESSIDVISVELAKVLQSKIMSPSIEPEPVVCTTAAGPTKKKKQTKQPAPKTLMTKEGTFSIGSVPKSKPKEKITIPEEVVLPPKEEKKVVASEVDSKKIENMVSNMLKKAQKDIKNSVQQTLTKQTENVFVNQVIPAVNAAFVEMKNQLVEEVKNSMPKTKEQESETDIIRINQELLGEIELLKGQITSLAAEMQQIRMDTAAIRSSAPLPPIREQRSREHLPPPSYYGVPPPPRHQPPHQQYPSHLQRHDSQLSLPPGLDRPNSYPQGGGSYSQGSYREAPPSHFPSHPPSYDQRARLDQQSYQQRQTPPLPSQPLPVKRNDSVTSSASGPLFAIRQYLMQDDFPGAFYTVFTQEDKGVEHQLISTILKYMENSNKMNTATLGLLPSNTVMKVFQAMTAEFASLSSSPTLQQSFDFIDFKRKLHFIQNATLSLNKDGLGYYTATVAYELSQSLDILFQKLSSFARITSEMGDSFKMVDTLLKALAKN